MALTCGSLRMPWRRACYKDVVAALCRQEGLMLRSVTTACLPLHTLPQNAGGLAQRWPNKPSWPPEKLGAGWETRTGQPQTLPIGASGTGWGANWLQRPGRRGLLGHLQGPSLAMWHKVAAEGAHGARTAGMQGASSHRARGSRVTLTLVPGSDQNVG